MNMIDVFQQSINKCLIFFLIGDMLIYKLYIVKFVVFY